MPSISNHPSLSLFSVTNTADLPTFRTHVVSLARAGLQPVVNGSMGEAHHLTAEERTTLVREARAALDAAGFDDVVIIAGT